MLPSHYQDVARELQTSEPFVARMNDVDTSFKVFERSTRSPHPLVQCLDSVTATTESSTAATKSISLGDTTTTASTGDIGCSQSSQAAKGDEGICEP